MQGYNIGYYIKRIRQEKGISQEALYKGLCSRSTIHRIESGKQQPTMFTAIHLLQRLGLDENSFLVPLGPQDFEICNLKKEIVALNAQFQFEQALERIDRLEKLVAPKDRLAQQFLLRSRALAGYRQDGERLPYDYPTQRRMLLDALDITHPDFDLEKIERCLLSIEDIKSLNQIAITYSETGDRRFAIRIYEQLLRYPSQNLLSIDALLGVMPMLHYNCSRLLGLEKRFEEELEVAQTGYEICVKYNRARMMGGLLLNMACALQELGRDEESKKKFAESYSAYYLMVDLKSCELIKEHVKKTYNMELNLPF